MMRTKVAGHRSEFRNCDGGKGNVHGNFSFQKFSGGTRGQTFDPNRLAENGEFVLSFAMSIPKSEDGDFVEGIYNWCDRWCERCPMTARCRQYAMECTRDAFNADGSCDGDSAEFMEALMCTADRFEEQAMDERETADFFEPSFEFFEDDEGDEEDGDMEAFIRERDRLERATGGTYCVRLTDRYMGEGGRWLEEWESLVDALEDRDGELSDAVEVIGWYLFQLSVKLRRAVNGKLEDETYFRDDVCGSAKVVLIGADRSLAAWRLIRARLPREQRDSVDPVIDLLVRVIAETEREIPGARAFKRPGFDD